jgi:broad specificity phosphatase PhoE
VSELILVRHGQASFGAESYDKLSELGLHQARLLAQHWAELGERFDHLYCGTLLRQRETASALMPLVNGLQEPSQHPGLNEYSGDALIRIYLRDHADTGPFSGLTFPVGDPRLFQQIFEAATALWVRGELQPAAEDEDFEPWPVFQRRVHGVVDEIMARHRSGSRVLVASSGGVIAMTLQRVLQFPDEHVISTNWMVHNSSVSRIKYGNGRVSLTQFNALPHLERSDRLELVTYR